MPGAADTGVVGTHEAASLFSRHLAGLNSIVLAVSGGSDSIALMWLMANWKRDLHPDGRPGIRVVTVDHALRPESSDEADFVLREAERADLPAQKLIWQGPHPKTGLAAAARQARYTLMAQVCRRHDAALVTAHTLDDQAETLVMALARGAGVDGLSAMQVRSDLNGLTIVRPLLEVSRSRLRATLSHSGAGWVDDPTNLDRKYERVRVREALRILGVEGVTAADLARSSRRLARAREALQQAAIELSECAVVHETTGFARIKKTPFLRASDEIQLRVLLMTLEVYGGGVERSLAGAEDLLDWMHSETGRARTFAGCRIARRAAEFVIGRECSRISEEVRKLEPGQCAADWDRRYQISNRQDKGHVKLSVVRDATVSELPKRPPDIPDFVWQGLPVAVDLQNRVYLPFSDGPNGSKSQQNVVFSFVGGRKSPQS